MGRIVATIVCAGVGFWLGSHRLVPLWVMVALAVLGAGLWLWAEWLERRGGLDDDAR